MEDFASPADTILLDELARAVDLRRREDFDRVLDAPQLATTRQLHA